MRKTILLILINEWLSRDSGVRRLWDQYKVEDLFGKGLALNLKNRSRKQMYHPQMMD